MSPSLSFLAARRAMFQSTTRALARQATRGAAALAASPSSAADFEHMADHQAAHSSHGQHHPVATPAPRRDEFWREVPVYKNVSTEDFLSYWWGIRYTVQTKRKLLEFLYTVVPEEVPLDKSRTRTQSRVDFLTDVLDGIEAATMAVRVTPYVLSRINWSDPRNDPIFRQFIPLKSVMLPDHPKLSLDSLHETADSPVRGLVHRYPDKALLLATSVCPTYCTFCTRSYSVGANTDAVTKTSFLPTKRRWDEALAYIEATPGLQDVVVSGGDSYYLHPEHVRWIGARLTAIPHVRRFRFASRGLAVSPGRVLDPEDDWAAALGRVSLDARRAGKSVALHTHFNHPDEVSWVTREAAQRLFDAGVVVRNQTVLLRGVNDDLGTMSTLIRTLADNNITPYYVYMCDMVKTNEHLRTPLQTILDLEAQIRGSIAGFMTPQFVVDLPGGGGKRLACSYESYDRATGVSRFVAPAVTAAASSAAGGGGRARASKPEVFEYYDPVVPGVDAAGM